MFDVKELLEITSGKLILKGKKGPASGISIDSRTIKRGEVFIAIKGPCFDGHDFVKEAIKKGAKSIIAMRYLPRVRSKSNVNLIMVSDTVKALGDIAKYHRKKFDIPVIAITGSNGKTTTKELVSWLLEDKFKVLKSPGTQNNQIGLPMTLLRLSKRFGVAVLEIGTNHFGEVDYLTKIARPNIGIITNIGPSHLEFLHSFNDVYREKYALIKNLISPFIGILNMDDAFLKQSGKKHPNGENIIGFSIKNNSDFKASKVLRGNTSVTFTVNAKYILTINNLGVYNVYNALAAISAARLFGVGYSTIARRLAVFEFPAGRLTLKQAGGTNFIDDTYNANPASLERALEALRHFKTKGRKIFAMGDMLELGSFAQSFHRQAGKTVARVCDAFISVGNLSRLTADVARKSGMPADEIFICSTSGEAREVLFHKIKPTMDDAVLVKGSRLMQMENVIKNR